MKGAEGGIAAFFGIGVGKGSANRSFDDLFNDHVECVGDVAEEGERRHVKHDEV